MERKADTSRYIYIYIYIYEALDFTGICPRGFYTAVNFKLTLKGNQGKLLLMKMCKSVYNSRINIWTSHFNWNNNYVVIGHHTKTSSWISGPHRQRALLLETHNRGLCLTNQDGLPYEGNSRTDVTFFRKCSVFAVLNSKQRDYVQAWLH
jgi:hypothetical protein